MSSHEQSKWEGGVTAKLEAIHEDVVFIKENHGNRIRSLEKWKWLLVGLMAASAGISIPKIVAAFFQ
jgi:hypothetical protein